MFSILKDPVESDMFWKLVPTTVMLTPGSSRVPDLTAPYSAVGLSVSVRFTFSVTTSLTTAIPAISAAKNPSFKAETV